MNCTVAAPIIDALRVQISSKLNLPEENVTVQPTGSAKQVYVRIRTQEGFDPGYYLDVVRDVLTEMDFPDGIIAFSQSSASV